MKRNLRRLVLLFFLISLGYVSTLAVDRHGREHFDELVLGVEERLSDLGYWIVKVDGLSDNSTRQAILAFQKVEGLRRTGQITIELLAALKDASRPRGRYSTDGRHIEIDISRQVLFIIDGSDVYRVLPISSGNERPYVEKGKRRIAHTPRGAFRIERQIKGIRRAPLGTLYFPNYFTDGVAIHGSDSVPATPASHGCVRIPRFAEREFSSMVHIGTAVYVYD